MMNNPERRSVSRRVFPILLATLLISPVLATAPGVSQFGPDFQYGGPVFDDVAQTSYETVGLSGSFTDWLAKAYTSSGVRLGNGTDDLNAALDARRIAIGAASSQARVKLERETAAWAHKFIKKAIPKFSLERGFELANVVKTGERQCLAQSFIISGLLQRAGMQAGAVMVWANPEGKQSNLGHVVSVVRLNNDSDLLVDASDPTPFMRHQGLLVKTGEHYSFVKPSYRPDDTISGYSLAGGGKTFKLAEAAPLTLSYLKSQFDYYRGERAIGGILGTAIGKAPPKATPEGLKQSAVYLSRAVQEEPQNALASFMLGHVLARQGQIEQARAQYTKANSLYLTQGHVPAGVQTSIDALNKPAKAGKS
jgi:hypothetical protein